MYTLKMLCRDTQYLTRDMAPIVQLWTKASMERKLEVIDQAFSWIYGNLWARIGTILKLDPKPIPSCLVILNVLENHRPGIINSIYGSNYIPRTIKEIATYRYGLRGATLAYYMTEEDINHNQDGMSRRGRALTVLANLDKCRSYISSEQHFEIDRLKAMSQKSQ